MTSNNSTEFVFDKAIEVIEFIQKMEGVDDYEMDRILNQARQLAYLKANVDQSIKEVLGGE